MKTLLMITVLSLLATCAFAQGVIQGKINDMQAKGISYANVLLKSEADSILFKGAIADESGGYVFEEIQQGKYFVEIVMMGYANAYSPVFNFLGTGISVLDPIALDESTENLDEVTVTATRPFFELESGKMIINVANSVTAAGLSVIDVLERSPGVMVNRQSNSLSVLGKNGIVILMNGKRFRMPIDAAYQMLAGLNSSEVEKIEIITVPPSQYDADGDAGFINVVMKRNNSTIGTNGSVTLGQGYGSGYNGNLSFNINHQGPKFSWFGLLSSVYTAQVMEWETIRGNNDGFEDILIETYSERKATRKTLNYQAGFDYVLGKKTILSGLVSGYDNRWDMTAPTTSNSTYSISPDTLVTMNMVEVNSWHHIMGNINLQHTFNNGQVISSNLDYLTYKNSNPTLYTNNFFTQSNDLFRSEEFRISKDTPIDLWVADVQQFSLKIN